VAAVQGAESFRICSAAMPGFTITLVAFNCTTGRRRLLAYGESAGGGIQLTHYGTGTLIL
jgi:hypothetical protein